jgi:hypothetical protein
MTALVNVLEAAADLRDAVSQMANSQDVPRFFVEHLEWHKDGKFGGGVGPFGDALWCCLSDIMTNFVESYDHSGDADYNVSISQVEIFRCSGIYDYGTKITLVVHGPKGNKALTAFAELLKDFGATLEPSGDSGYAEASLDVLLLMPHQLDRLLSQVDDCLKAAADTDSTNVFTGRQLLSLLAQLGMVK